MIINNEIASCINNCLIKHGIDSEISGTDLVVTDNIVKDPPIDQNRLSNLIIDHLWPSIRTQEVFHYTCKKNAISILSSKKLRLYNILKRYGEGEIESFCKIHNLTGYLEEDENGIPYYKRKLMPHLFYTSFTETKISPRQENYFWKEFAKGDGVRFKFKVSAKNPNFRRIIYEEEPRQPISLLYDINSVIEKDFNRKFILTGISRLCSFYLYNRYQAESELRMLYKANNCSDPNVLSDGEYEYIEQKFGLITATGYRIDLIEVQTDLNITVPKSVRLLRKAQSGKQ